MASLMRPCAACGQVDDHPRDIVIRDDGNADLYHHDCHAGCPGCEWLVQHKGDLKGSKWRDHIGSLHAELTPDQLATNPAQRSAVDSHLNGEK